MSTLYQRWAVEHILGANPPRYAKLAESGYRTVLFQPQEPNHAKRIADAHSHHLTSGLWFDDPSSAGSPMRPDPEGFADDVIKFVRAADMVEGGRSDIVYLDIEFTGKGYPTWKANVNVGAWAIWDDGGGHLWQTWQDGTTGSARPSWPAAAAAGSTVSDGSVTWRYQGAAVFSGWDWNELMMARLRRPVKDGGMPERPVMVQPMGHQGDFNYGAYLKQRRFGTAANGSALLSPPARVSPQCYDGSMNPFDVKSCIDEIVGNSYCVSHYGFSPSRPYIHPSLSPCHADFYNLTGLGARGYTLFREDYMNDGDFSAYTPYMVP